MQKNDLIKVHIEDMTNDGEGIGHSDGFTLFVKDAVIGDTVLARVTRPKKTYAYARVEQVLVSSPDRVAPACPKARSCGGCRMQELAYEKQLAFKEDLVRRNLTRLGGFSDIPMEPIIGMEEPFRYRNKAQYPIGTSKKEPGRLTTGFYAGRTHDIIDIRDCMLAPARNADILRAILAFAEEHHLPAYDEAAGTGLLRHVLIREGFTSGEVLICLVINGRKLPKAGQLVEKLLALSPFPDGAEIKSRQERDVGSVLQNVQQHDLLRFGIIPELIGRMPVVFTLSPMTEDMSGRDSFFEAPPWPSLPKRIAPHAKDVYGVEIVPEAILDAKENAARNGLKSTHFFTAAAEDVAERGYFDEHTPLVRPDVIVVDPPRKGCEASLLHTIRALAPDRVVYVSCDSATLARDLKILCAEGEGARYELARVRPCDMFPHTGHVETVVLLTRNT